MRSRTSRSPRPAPAAPSHPLRWAALGLAVAAVLVYANALGSAFILDDNVSVLDNPQIHRVWTLDVLRPEREQPVAGRPLANVTLAVNYALGGTDPRGYHAVNLLFHLLCAIAAMALVREALLLPSLRARAGPYTTEIAFMTALVWLVHPLNSEVINYVTQRTESMMTLCYLLTLYASLRAIGGGWWWNAVAVVACLLGMASKESMATAPLMVMLFDRVFVFPSWAAAFGRRKWLYAGLSATWALPAVLVLSNPRPYSAGFATGVGVWTYLLNQTRMLTRYLWLIVWPVPLVVYYGAPVPVTLAEALPQALLVSALAAATLVAFRFRPHLAFLGAWFFITLAPSSSIIPIATEVGAERRMYLPLLGILAGVAVLVVPLAAERLRATPRRAILAGVVLLLAAATIARNREFTSTLTLAEVTFERWPTGMSHHLLGEQLLLNGRTEEGVAHLREAVETAPRAHYSLGEELLREGRLDEAIFQLQEFIRRQPLLLEVPAAHVLLARAYAERNDWNRAATEAREAIAKAPDNPAAHAVLADALMKQERMPDAVAAYTAYLRLQPGDAGGWTRLGVTLAAIRQFDAAANAFQRVVALTPDSGDAHRNLATALLDANRPGEAATAARAAMTLRPGDPVPPDLLGQALARQGRFDEARAAFERAVAIDPSHDEARAHLAQIQDLLRRQ